MTDIIYDCNPLQGAGHRKVTNNEKQTLQIPNTTTHGEYSQILVVLTTYTWWTVVYTIPLPTPFIHHIKYHQLFKFLNNVVSTLYSLHIFLSCNRRN